MDREDSEDVRDDDREGGGATKTTVATLTEILRYRWNLGIVISAILKYDLKWDFWKLPGLPRLLELPIYKKNE